MPTKTILWPAASIAELSENAITLLLEYAANIDICLIGCGLKTVLVPASIRQRLKDGGVKADVMDTGAACRTYNVLMAEGRSIAAALVAV